MTISKDRAKSTACADLPACNDSTPNPIMTRCLLSVAIASALFLVGCGSDSNDNDNAKNFIYPTTVESINSFTADQIDLITGTEIPAPDAKCDIKIEKVTYQTKGSAGEVTNATAALMLPSGDSADCQGDRPILLYAHGTTTEKSYDFSQVGNSQNPAVGEATLIAANFAAQGYIVVAPNYAGYDVSELDYHPYLVAEQQSADMVDALNNSRLIIDQQQNDINVDDSGELFISGYSQGGHVVMATARALEAQNKPVTAIAPSSGPYALAAFGDAIFAGNVNIGATAFAPLLATGLQKAYGNIYQNPTNIFRSPYADTRLPNVLSFGDLVRNGKLPLTALFQAAPTDIPQIDSVSPADKFGFAADNYLIQTPFRAGYLSDARVNPDGLLTEGGNGFPANSPNSNLRKALKINDLRGYHPKMPTLLCGGNQDPTVFYDLNTGSMTALLQGFSMQNPTSNINVTVFDVDKTNENNDDRVGKQTLTLIGGASTNRWNAQSVLTTVQASFANNANTVTSNVPTGSSSQMEFLINYHGNLVSKACTEATREFFEQNFNNVQQPL